MSSNLVSVIVPVYKVEQYLNRCVSSIIKQSHTNLEIILVDDGSPDRCPQLCDEWALQDSRIKVIHKENGGLSDARNVGLKKASGNYICFVDSDDYVSPHFIEELYQLLQDTGCAIGQCRFSYVKGDGLVEEGDSAFCIYRGESLMEQLYGPEEKATCFVVAWNKLYRAELFKETGIRYPEGRIHEDEATTYRLFHEAKKLAFLDRALYGYYTENGGSITSVFSAKRLQWLTAHEERIAFFKKNGYEKLLPAAYRKLCDACITFYFRCTEQVKDAEELKKELRKRLETYRANGAAWIAALPLKTRMGYELFSMSPGLYAKMLQKMQETS